MKTQHTQKKNYENLRHLANMLQKGYKSFKKRQKIASINNVDLKTSLFWAIV